MDEGFGKETGLNVRLHNISVPPDPKRSGVGRPSGGAGSDVLSITEEPEYPGFCLEG